MFQKAKNRLRRLLPKNAFARGVSVLVGGTAGAQVLTVLAAPLLTRLYSPEDFGLLAVYASLLALIAVISSLRYELAIPLPEDDGEAANVAALSLILVGLSALLAGVLVWRLGPAIADLLGVPALAGYLWLLPVGVLLSGAYQVFNYWAVRTKRFTTIAGTRLRQALATIAIQLAAFKLGGIALLFGQAAGQSVGTTSLGRPALASAGFRQVSWRGIARAAGRYQRFPIFTTWAGLVNTAGHQLPPMMFAAFFSAGAAGLYALAHRLLMLPSNLIGSAIGSVFLSHAADAHRNASLGALYAKLQDKLIQIGLPPAVFLIVIGPDLFEVIFGANWRTAGYFAQWLAAGAFAGFIVSPLSMVFSILEKQDAGLMLQLNLFFLRLAAITIGASFSDLLLTVALYSAASLLGYLAYVMAMSRITCVSLRRFGVSFVKSICYSLLAVSPIALVQYNGSAGSNAPMLIAALMSTSILLARYQAVARQHV
ncbi:membrane protein involved in the export of O-antigen and teichoic acid [Thioflavicoccus mobilis 8321]|uniref:Membrane protein involved in the export of O-antigen and teichoic acid n=1 Tax=Thioflavicoccus mobilis 8321 TaxID=765912 RepID=L0GQ69_9GAMM|nr:oligosaccharide flippase family protein [Thioflavicoccus mobilis]AGA88908.1 membrane protein involved in the export of O-antigen and teichoic acid [Thioflavicoccus mobilis 8321]